MTAESGDYWWPVHGSIHRRSSSSCTPRLVRSQESEQIENGARRSTTLRSARCAHSIDDKGGQSHAAPPRWRWIRSARLPRSASGSSSRSRWPGSTVRQEIADAEEVPQASGRATIDALVAYMQSLRRTALTADRHVGAVPSPQWSPRA